jgi:hypothetical protein
MSERVDDEHDAEADQRDLAGDPDEHGEVTHRRFLALLSIAAWQSSQTAIPHSGS